MYEEKTDGLFHRGARLVDGMQVEEVAHEGFLRVGSGEAFRNHVVLGELKT